MWTAVEWQFSVATSDPFHITNSHFIHCYHKNIDWFSFKVWIIVPVRVCVNPRVNAGNKIEKKSRALSHISKHNSSIDKIHLPQLLLFLLTIPVSSILSFLLTSRASLLHDNGEDLTLTQTFLTSATTVWAFPQSSSTRRWGSFSSLHRQHPN